MEKLAIFDVDYTITKKETLRELFYFLIRKKPTNVIHIPRAIFSGIMFLFNVYDERKTKENFLKFIHGIGEEEMKKIVREFYENRLSKIIYEDAINMMKKLKGEGYKVYLISASPEFYLNELYAIEEVDMIIGSRFKVEQGKYCRTMDGENCKGHEKVERLMEFLREKKIEVDFKSSYMFSDSMSDKPLFDIVGKPYLINYRKNFKEIEILRWR